MSAHNQLFASAVCPSCGQRSEMIFHIGAAASFGFDKSGERFHLRDYRVGDPLHWLEASDREFQDWHDDHRIQEQNDGSFLETGATAQYPKCKSYIWADVIYRHMMIESVGNVRPRPQLGPKQTPDR